ncbi:MAG: hypothetical protein Ct9H300mP14_16180 [Gammaproteobacteria bacterium]|nr:MAG: hypothetical protein Ct9H300mP14_16180 [Gammaproteobacteria bacterium]
MKAVQLQHYGGSDALSLVDVDIPTPGEGEDWSESNQQVSISSIFIWGKGALSTVFHLWFSPPFTLGMEAVGTVADANGDSRLQGVTVSPTA